MGSAYLIPIRRDANNNFEVLLAQSQVINYKHTFESGELWIYDHPGEIVCIGGEIRSGREPPEQAALRNFCEGALIPHPESAVLYSFRDLSGDVHFYTCTTAENHWLRSVSDEALLEKNLLFAERDKWINKQMVPVADWPETTKNP